MQEQWERKQLILSPNQVKNILKMNIRQHLNTGEHASALIYGPPGAGKSAVCQQAVEEINAADGVNVDFIVTHPVIDEPSDNRGQPWVIKDPITGKDSATHLPFERLLRLINATRPTVVLLDDLAHAMRATMNSITQLLWARQIGDFKLSDKVLFQAATNTMEHAAGGNPIHQALLQRFTTVLETYPNFKDFAEYGEATGRIHPHVLAYVRADETALIEVLRDERSLVRSPSPRNWEHCSTSLYGGALNRNVLSDQECKAVLAGAVGMAHAAGLWASIKLLSGGDMPRPIDVLTTPDKAKIPDDHGTYGPNKIWAVCGMICEVLASPANVAKRFPSLTYFEAAQNVGVYAQRLPKAFCSYLMAACARREAGQATREGRQAMFGATPVYIEWYTKHAQEMAAAA